MNAEHPLLNRKQLFLVGLITLIYLLFQSFLKTLFDDVMVNPVLSKIKPDQMLTVTILYLILLASLGYSIYSKITQKAFKASVVTSFVLLEVCIIYWYERFFAGDYNFSPLFHRPFCEIKVAFFDPLYFLLSVLTINLFVNYFRFAHYSSTELSILKQDLPIKTLAEERYKRREFFMGLIDEFKNVAFDSPKGFAMGINSAWGSGKTSLLNILKNDLTEDRGIICAEYNPWLAGSKLTLTQDFFVMMENELSKYIETSNLLVKYGEKLSKIDDDKNPLKKASDLFTSDKSISEQFDQIGELIKKTNRRIFVIVDDLDRLDNKEVLEVLRLVRNTANFPRIHFILAYDKDYIVNALKENKIFNAEAYLEKIFDLELVLPRIEDKTIREELHKSIVSSFDRMFPEGATKTALVDQLSSLVFDSTSSSSVKIQTVNKAVSMLFHSKRDILKFGNSLSLMYKITKDNVYFPDLFILELLKFKRADLYKKIAANDKYLAIDDTKNVRTYLLYDDNPKPGDQNLIENYFRPDLYDLRKSFEPDKVGVPEPFFSLVRALFENNPDDFNARHAIRYVDNFESYFINTTPNNVFTYKELEELIYD